MKILREELSRKVAEKLGKLCKFTGNLMKGIGTIRQDVNVSIKDGARVEIKGWQDIKTMEKLIKNEIIRQKNLIEIKNYLIKDKLNFTFEEKKDKLLISSSNFKTILEKNICENKTLLQELEEYVNIYNSKISIIDNNTIEISNGDIKNSSEKR